MINSLGNIIGDPKEVIIHAHVWLWLLAGIKISKLKYMDNQNCNIYIQKLLCVLLTYIIGKTVKKIREQFCNRLSRSRNPIIIVVIQVLEYCFCVLYSFIVLVINEYGERWQEQ